MWIVIFCENDLKSHESVSGIALIQQGELLIY